MQTKRLLIGAKVSSCIEKIRYIDLRQPSSSALHWRHPSHLFANHRFVENILIDSYDGDMHSSVILPYFGSQIHPKFRRCRHLGVLNLLPFLLIRTVIFKWTISWWSQKLCEMLFISAYKGSTLDAMRHLANHRIFGGRTSTATLSFVSKFERNVYMQV